MERIVDKDTIEGCSGCKVGGSLKEGVGWVWCGGVLDADRCR